MFVLTLISALGTPALAAAHCTGAATDPTAIGSGTPEDPWQICTVSQLRRVSQRPDGHFVLVDDLDLSGVEWPGLAHCSIWPTDGGFSGHFDGGGQVLSNLTSFDGSGLFGCIHGGTVENLRLRNVDIRGRADSVGGLAGYAEDAFIADVEVSGTVRGGEAGTAGLVGWTRSTTIERVSFTGSVRGHFHAGGIIGHAWTTELTDSYAYGEVVGVNRVGGLIGGAISNVGEPVRIDRCHAATTVDDDGTFAEPDVGTAVGWVLSELVFGATDGSGQDASITLANDGLPTVGWAISSDHIRGTVSAAGRDTFLDPDTYARAGWDLMDVWVPPSETSVPVLR